MTDKLMITIMALAMIFFTHYVSYQFGRKAECERSGNYFSHDFSKCISPKELNDFIKR